jgi:tRNA-specific 2-thiouridylase
MSDTFLPSNGFDTYETQDKVLVGLNGSVDSGVVAGILRQQGFGVAGAVIQLSPAHEQVVAAAKHAAEQLGIECIVLHAEELFPAESADAKNGVSASCAQLAALAAAADRLGIQYIATGHCARVEVDEAGLSHIGKPLNTVRDQSSLLHDLPQELLDRLILPLGEFDESDVREMASEFKLDGRDRAEVQ